MSEPRLSERLLDAPIPDADAAEDVNAVCSSSVSSFRASVSGSAGVDTFVFVLVPAAVVLEFPLVSVSMLLVEPELVPGDVSVDWAGSEPSPRTRDSARRTSWAKSRSWNLVRLPGAPVSSYSSWVALAARTK